jgi:Rod binding domain-containing protein
MRPLSVSQLLPAQALQKGKAPDKIKDAAQQFESILLAQFLRSARGGGTGWLGGDATSESLTDMAEQQLATVLSKSGGFGISDLVSRGLTSKP